MRIGEVTVISPPGNTKEIFIQSVCQNLEKVSETISFGRLQINHQLVLHLYGISIESEETSISWDLLSPKMLGYIFIFNWDDYSTFEEIKTILDTFSIKFSAPIIIVANVKDKSNIPLPEKFNEPGGFSIDRNIRFTFGQISDPIYSKKVVSTIMEILINKIN